MYWIFFFNGTSDVKKIFPEWVRFWFASVGSNLDSLFWEGSHPANGQASHKTTMHRLQALMVRYGTKILYLLNDYCEGTIFYILIF